MLLSLPGGDGDSRQVRGWKLPLRSDKDLDDLARMFNAVIRGWINYYGAFYKSALYPALRHLDRKLALWATRKFKRLRRHRRRAEQWLRQVAQRQPGLFALALDSPGGSIGKADEQKTFTSRFVSASGGSSPGRLDWPCSSPANEPPSGYWNA